MRPCDPRSAATVPLALLSSACVLVATRPALASPPYADGLSGERVTTSLPSPDVMTRWQLPPESPWAPYAKQTLFSALDTGQPLWLPDVRQLPVVAHAVMAATSLATGGLPPDVMWVADMRGAASVAFAATLKRASREDIAPVLTFNNWPMLNEVVPAEEALSALLIWQPLPTAISSSARPVFVLDAWRLAYAGEAISVTAVDNRYMLTPADLPDPTMLRDQGITRVAYVVESAGEFPVEEDDLNATFLDYQAAGIELSLVDLAALASWPRSPGDWAAWLEAYRYYPRVRPTIVNDPLFFALSQGGFGGVGAVALGGAHGFAGHGGG